MSTHVVLYAASQGTILRPLSKRIFHDLFFNINLNHGILFPIKGCKAFVLFNKAKALTSFLLCCFDEWFEAFVLAQWKNTPSLGFLA
jgi:hypothetical protein